MSVVIGEISNGELDIILWLMSSRVLKRDMKFAMMDTLVQECGKRRISSLKNHVIRKR